LKTFFTSDTHFGHENIIRFCNRPFASVYAMNRAMIENWNSVVSEGDEVYHLGDFAFGNSAYWSEMRGPLNGTIYLIKGNHDKQFPQRLFGWVKDYAEIVVENQKIVLFHYGMRTWHHDLRGVWHLYGHSHNALPPYGKSVDVGVDKWDFTPVSFEKLKTFMDAREIGEAPRFPNYQPAQV
jgi:calcineurin-like phosphoesterase family protein